MSPSFVGDDKVNYMTTNAKHFAKFFARFLLSPVKLSNLQNRGLVEYSIMMDAASTKTGGAMPSFVNFVVAVVLMSAKKQMFGIDALAIIAGVANKKPFGDFSNIKSIRKAMGKKLFPVVGSSSPCGSITTLISSPVPVPTL
jgi:hypothetical protein